MLLAGVFKIEPHELVAGTTYPGREGRAPAPGRRPLHRGRAPARAARQRHRLDRPAGTSMRPRPRSSLDEWEATPRSSIDEHRLDRARARGGPRRTRPGRRRLAWPRDRPAIAISSSTSPASARGDRSGSQPVALLSLVLSPRSTGTSTGRSSAGSWRSAHGRSRRLETSRSAMSSIATSTPRAHVVRLACLTVFHQQSVGADDVAHVGEVAPRREVADGHDAADRRTRCARCVRRARVRRTSALARAEVVERPHP